MPRFLLPATGLAAAGVAAACLFQLRQPASLETRFPMEAAAGSELTSRESTAGPGVRTFAAPSLPAAESTSAIAPRLRGSDETPVGAPVDFDAIRPATRRFEIYARVPVTRNTFTSLPAPVPRIALDLAPGTREPIALLEEGDTCTPAQTAALDSTAEAFLDRVEQAADNASDGDLAATWDQAQADADSIYRNIFGEAAYHQRLTEAAIRALGRSVSEP